ncbi:MAG TPA: hypothetical protein VFX19_04050, partial [Dehalococcoidia bacterium]|nr:hypothetical protein [Dehalococcoidia bacterium]
SEHHVGHDSSGHLMKSYRSQDWRGRHAFANAAKLAKLPTGPRALRLAIERGPEDGAPAPATSQNGNATAETLIEILTEPLSGPGLRAAAFDALAEIPGIEPEQGVRDANDRHGNALDWNRDRGFGSRLIFDRERSKLLAEAEMTFGPPSTTEYDVPPDTPFRETAYLESRLVDSEP